MFALKTEKSFDDSKKRDSSSPGLKDKILIIYKKLKKIANCEFNTKNKFKLATLSSEELIKLKSFESNLNLSLLAYEDDQKKLNKKKLNEKIEILNQINNLLNNYFKLSGDNGKRYTNEDFSKFFE